MKTWQVVQTEATRLKAQEVWSDLDAKLIYHPRDGILRAVDIEAVKTSVDNILRTYPFERVMRPTFASNLGYMLFEPLSDSAIRRASSEIEKIITTWDDRVIVNSVKFSIDSDKSQVDIVVSFSVRGYDQVFSQQVSFPIGG